MFVLKKENESPNETCMRCIAEYSKLSSTSNFDYSQCTHCEISQKIHKEDSSVWNGHCRYLR